MSVGSDLTDMHTACLNRLTGAFLPDACKGKSPGNKGYNKIVDPKFNHNGESVETDFLSIGISDAQYYKIVGAKAVIGEEDGIIYDSEKISSQLEKLNEMSEISQKALDEYLSAKDISSTPSIQEFVAVLPYRAYSYHQQVIDQFCEENNIIAWTASLEGTEKIQKVSGKHNAPELDELLSGRGNQEGIFLYDIDSSICPVVRESDMQLIKFVFADRLITYSYREQTTQIPYSEIDSIMLNHDRPILGHLSEEERDDYWQQCMLTLQTTMGVISESQKEMDVFEWEKEKFLYDNSARSRLLEQIRSGLGIGEEA